MTQIPMDFNWIDLADIALIALLFYAVIINFKRARAGLALAGLLMLGAIYLLASQVGLNLTAWILRGFAPVFLIMLVVIFQRDLRRIFERLAVWSFRRGAPGGPLEEATNTLVHAMGELASCRNGALVVIPGKDPLERHLQGGVELDGKLSNALLLSLFDPNSGGHDGAVVIRGDRVSHFSLHLPLSSNFAQIGSRGTRHSAALGLSERTDALCIVVSEETGDLSLARDGVLHQLRNVRELREALEKEVRAPRAQQHRANPFRVLSRNWLEKCAATLLAGIAWLAFVSGSQMTQRTLEVPVVLENVHPAYTVEKIEPAVVSVTVTGLRRDLYLIDPAVMEARVDSFLVGFGRKTFEIAPRDIVRPRTITVLNVEPRTVQVSAVPQATSGDKELRKKSAHPPEGRNGRVEECGSQAPQLAGAATEENDAPGLKQDEEIQQERPLPQIKEIIFELALGILDAGAVAVLDLGPARDARAHGMAFVVAGHLFPQPLDNLGALGPRTYQTHLSPQDVQQLGQLIDPVAAQIAADTRDSGVAWDRPSRAAVGFGVPSHGAELEHPEWRTVQAQSALAVENRARRIEPDGYGRDRHQW